MITTQSDKYAIYLRKSRQDIEAEALGEGETLARHRNILFKLAEKHSILPEQITVYQEIVSGDSISERPEMQRLLNDVYQRKYKGVLVVEVERLARGNTKDQGEVADAFQYGNTKIYTPVKVYDPNNEFDQEYFEFGLFMSRREYKTIKRRMEAGRLESVAEGNYVGSIRPYGYDVQRNNKKERILIEKPEESKYVKLMFNWFTNDRLSAGQIARKLTDMHVPTMTGNNEWNRATVKDILQNIHYTGKVRWNRRKSSKEYNVETGKLSKRKRRLTPEDYLVYEGKHKGIISQEQFELAQTLFTGQVPVSAAETVINPLAGILVCAKCGKSIRYASYSSKKNTTPRFVHPESTICKLKSCAADTVMEAVLDGISATAEDFEVKMTNDAIENEMAEKQQILSALEAEKEKLKRKREKLFDAFEDGAYTKAEFLERKQILNSNIDSMTQQIEALEQDLPNLPDYEEKAIQLRSLLEHLKNPDVSAKEKNIFLKAIIDRIEYDAEDNGRNKGTKPIIDIYLK